MDNDATNPSFQQLGVWWGHRLELLRGWRVCVSRHAFSVRRTQRRSYNISSPPPGPSNSADLAVFDFNTNAWSTGPSVRVIVLPTTPNLYQSWSCTPPIQMPTARGVFDMASVVQSKLFVVGGGNPQPTPGVLEYFDPSTNAWYTGPPMVRARCPTFRALFPRACSIVSLRFPR